MNVFAATLLTLLLACPALADGPPPYWSEELSDILAVAGTSSGAVATARAGEKRTSAVRFKLSPENDYRGLVIKGQVRSLLFVEDGAGLLAVVQKQSKRKTWDTFLLKIDTTTSKTSRLVTLPRTAAGMTLWPGARHLLVACDQEIRSFILPGFRSGPLYQLPGGNLALAHHSGPLFLIGRTDDLVLVNLEDPQGQEQIPVRQRFGLANPLRSMTVSSDATRLYGVTLDGAKMEQPLDVLDLAAAVLPIVREPEPDWITAPVEMEAPPALPAPERQPAPVIVEKQKVQEAEAPPVPKPAPVVVEKPRIREEAVPQGPAPQPQPEPKPRAPVRADDFQVFGTIQGAAADQVRWVLVLGPNNILREATRVRPDAGGRWGVESLPAGRYRLVLDGGGERVIEAEPRFATIQVTDGEPLEVPPFDAQRAR